MADLPALRMSLQLVRLQLDAIIAALDEPTGECPHPAEAVVDAGSMGSPNLRVCTRCGAEIGQAKEE